MVLYSGERHDRKAVHYSHWEELKGQNMILEDEFVIDYPVDSVFSHMAVELRPHWVTGAVEREKLTEGPVGKGTRFRAVDQFGNRRIEAIDEIIAYEPNRLLSESWDGPFPGNGTIRLFDENGSTRVRRHFEIDTSGLFSLLAPLMKPFVKRSLNRDLERFKELIASDAN